jgi:hypothetical protein
MTEPIVPPAAPPSGEGFLRRWARRKTEVAAGVEPAPEPVAEQAPVVAPAPAAIATSAAVQPDPAPAAPLPTMADVASLTRDSDFSAFVTRGVDADVRRGALKKLFSDPHFNKVDMLDVYMDDFTKPSPVSAAMLAGLQHAKSVFWRPEEEEEAAVAGDEAGAVASAATAPVTPAVAAEPALDPVATPVAAPVDDETEAAATQAPPATQDPEPEYNSGTATLNAKTQ